MLLLKMKAQQLEWPPGNFLLTKKPSAVYLKKDWEILLIPITSLVRKGIFCTSFRQFGEVNQIPRMNLNMIFKVEITLEQLKLLNIDYMILNTSDTIDFQKIKQTLDKNKSIALIIKKNYFKKVQEI